MTKTVGTLGICFFAAALAACAADDFGADDSFEGDEIGADGKADSVGSVSTYFIARQDARKCVYPLCGGLWVSRVNRELTTCTDGVKRAECYVPQASYATVRFDEGEAAYFDGRLRGGLALVRGSIASRHYPGFGNLGQLKVTEAWDAVTDQAPEGSFHKLTATGIVCVTSPCPTLHQQALNSSSHGDLTGLNLDGLNVAEELKSELFIQAYEDRLLAAGYIAAKPGAGTDLVVSQAFIRLYHKIAGEIVGEWAYRPAGKDHFYFTFLDDGTFTAFESPKCLRAPMPCAIKQALLTGTWAPNHSGSSLHLEYTDPFKGGTEVDFAVEGHGASRRLVGVDFETTIKLRKL